MAELPRLSKLEVRIIDLLLAKPREGMYGAAIVAHGVAEGSVYTTLGRMVDKGFVESYRQTRQGGPPRRYFRLTPSGTYAIAVHRKLTELAEVMAGEWEGVR